MSVHLLQIGLSNAVVAVGMAGIVMIVTRKWHSAPLAHFLWVLVLVKLVTPPLIDLRIPLELGRGRLPALETTSRGNQAAADFAHSAAGEAVDPFDLYDPHDVNANELGELPKAEQEWQARTYHATGTEHSALPDSAVEKIGRHPKWPQLALAVWVGGAIVVLGLAGVRLRSFRKLVARAAAAPPKLQQEVRQVARRVGVSGVPQVRVCGARIVPLVCCLGGRAVLLLPRPLLSSLDDDQRTTLLAHELAHLRRRDHWLAWLTLLIVGVYWWNPVAWFARCRLRRAADECCDGCVAHWFPDKVLSYAEGMLKVVDFLAEGARPVTSLASGIGQLHCLRRRFEMLLNRRTNHRLTWPIRLGAAAVAAPLLLLSPLFLSAEGQRAGNAAEELRPFGLLPDEERFAWQPEELVSAFGTHRGRHWWEVYAVAYSPDGRLIATGSGAKNLRLWDAGTMRERASVMGLPGTVQSVAFSPDGKHLAAGLSITVEPGQQMGEIRIWEISPECRLAEIHRLADFERRIVDLEYSPDGRKLAVACYSGGSGVRLFDMTGPHPHATYGLPTPDRVWDIALSPDGKSLAAACGKWMALWDLAGGEPIERARIRTSALSVAFSPDGQTLATGSLSDEETIRIWSLRQEVPVERAVLRDVAKGGISALTFSPDGGVLAASSGRQNVLRLWKMHDARPEVLAAMKGHHLKTFDLAFSPDGEQLASASSDNTLRLWTIGSEPQESDVSRAAHDGVSNVESVQFLPDGRSMVALHASAVETAHALSVFDVPSRRIRTRLKLPAGERCYFYSMHLAPDGSTVATVGRQARAISEDIKTGQSLAGDETSVMLWDLASGKRLYTLSGFSGGITSVAFSLDSRSLAAATTDGVIRAWGTANGEPVASIGGHARKLIDVAFVDQQSIVTLGESREPGGRPQGVIQLWHLRDGELAAGTRWEIPNDPAEIFGAVSRDGRVVAVQRRGKDVQVWEFRDGSFHLRTVLKMDDPQYFVGSVSPDNRLLAMKTWGSTKDAVAVWDTTSGQRLREWQFPGNATEVTFTPDSRHLATVNQNGTVYVLQIPPRDIGGPAQNAAAPSGAASGGAARARKREGAGGLQRELPTEGAPSQPTERPAEQGGTPAAESNERLKQEILAAVRRRSASVRSFDFRWTENSTPADEEILKKYLDEAAQAKEPARAVQMMEEAHTLVAMHEGGDYRLAVDGAKVRFDQRTGDPTGIDPIELVPRESVAVFDGEIIRRATTGGTTGYPLASIMRGNATLDLEFVGSIPIVAALRGATWLASYEATATWSELDGQRVAVLTLEVQDGHARGYTLWCDPQKDYQPVRIERRFTGTVRARYEIVYGRDDSTVPWVPVLWTRTMLRDDGTVHQQVTSTVTQFAIGEAIQADEFEVEFPPRSYVRDTVNDEEYIIFESGEHRVVTPEEREAGLTYEELLQPLNDEKDG